MWKKWKTCNKSKNYERAKIIIAVINTIDKEPKEECGKFITSKEENTELHGIGIQNIKDTVEKYGGTCVIRYDQMIFQFIIVISENWQMQ